MADTYTTVCIDCGCWQLASGMAHFTLGNVLKCKVQQVIEMGASSGKKYTVLQQLLHGTGNYTNHLKYCTNPQTLKIIYFCILLYADLEN